MPIRPNDLKTKIDKLVNSTSISTPQGTGQSTVTPAPVPRPSK